jgi:phosphoribosylpyrophosphate synthetase
VHAFATHPLCTCGALEALNESALEEIAVTDTVAVDSPERYTKLSVLSVSGLLAQTI